MSAMVLRTGSRTRKLTDRELIRLACWHVRNAAAVISHIREQTDALAYGTEPPEPPEVQATEFDWEESEAQFAALPAATQDFWRTVAECNYFTLCTMLGDHGRFVGEEGGAAL